MLSGKRFATYSRLKICACTLFVLAMLVGCCWMLLEVGQGTYGGRRSPATVVLTLVPAMLGCAVLCAVAITHLVKSLTEEAALFSENGALRIRGVRNVVVPLAEIASVSRSSSDPGRIVIEGAGGRRYFFRSSLMRERSQDNVAALSTFLIEECAS